MTDLITLNAVKQTDRRNDNEYRNSRFREPAFAAVTVQSSSNWGAIVYDHNLNMIGRFSYQGDGSYNPFGTTSSNGSEGGNNYYSYARTDSNASSNSSTYGNLTCRNSHLGHSSVNVGANGTMSLKHNGIASEANRNLGTWLNTTNPEMIILQSNNNFYTGPRSFIGGTTNTFGMLSQITTRFHNADDFSTNSKFGMLSYNEKTKQLAIGESDASYHIRFHIYSDVEAPTSFDVPNDFWSVDNISPDRKVITPWSDYVPFSNTSEDNYRAVVVMADNGDVVFHRMVPHNGYYSNKFILNGDGTYTFGGSAESIHDSWTTCYGYEQGSDYGVRYQMTMDGKYVIAYNAAYYYGAGWYATVIRVSDGKRLYTSNKDSSYGFMPAPIRDNKFVFSRDVNTDSGNMLYLYEIDCEYEFATKDDKAGLTYKGAQNYMIDTHYHSTNYPYIVPMGIVQDGFKFLPKNN